MIDQKVVPILLKCINKGLPFKKEHNTEMGRNCG